ncbi:MAG: hypothetical protein DRQ55_06375 [Planctomycetota bacterium]|nr:MAG: hypothetical protein DRQ55_06375 [Planctomycetota bacterium]
MFTEDDLMQPDQELQLGVAPVRIDVLTSISGVTFDEAWAARRAVLVDGQTVPVLSREHLIINEQATGRPQDLIDVGRLTLRRLLRRRAGWQVTWPIRSRDPAGCALDSIGPGADDNASGVAALLELMLSLESIGYWSDEPESQHDPPLLAASYPSTGDFVAFVSDLEHGGAGARSEAGAGGALPEPLIVVARARWQGTAPDRRDGVILS